MWMAKGGRLHQMVLRSMDEGGVRSRGAQDPAAIALVSEINPPIGIVLSHPQEPWLVKSLQHDRGSRMPPMILWM